MHSWTSCWRAPTLAFSMERWQRLGSDSEWMTMPRKVRVCVGSTVLSGLMTKPNEASTSLTRSRFSWHLALVVPLTKMSSVRYTIVMPSAARI